MCVEGINGSGKTTLANVLVGMWPSGYAQAIDPVQHTVFGDTIRTAIMTVTSLAADAETLAFASARLHTAGILAGNRCPPPQHLVVLERWAGAVVAYGTVAGASPFLLRALEGSLTGAIPVDVTMLVDVPGDVAEDRLIRLGGRNRFETLGPGYLERVRRQYLAWASIRQVPVINGQQGMAAVADQAVGLIEARAAATGDFPQNDAQESA
ncbi:dTMP kinase [Spirillospora sp. NPDC048823]|uniref:dTMP kinase n=1 Tax=unclassified Spirillospora TaxID=2642701 RepID=UPI003713A370